MYSFEQLRSETANKLVAEVNNRLKSIGEAGGLDKIPLALEAQIFINELLRRDQDKHTKAMLCYTRSMNRMAITMTVMTLCILGLTVGMFVLTARLVPGCGTAREESSLAANRELVRRQHEEVWSKGNLAIIDEIYARDFVGHFPFGQLGGREEIKQRVALHRSSFPDWTEQIEDIIAEGDRVVTRFISQGTHQGEFRGISATGRSVEIGEVAIYRIADGKIAEQWVFPDVVSLLAQLKDSSNNP